MVLKYRASDYKDFSKETFEKHCPKNAAVIVLLKIEGGKICGGFTMKGFSHSRQQEPAYSEDEDAVIFSVDARLKFRPESDQRRALFNFGNDYLFSFGNKSLAVLSKKQDGKMIAHCSTSDEIYKVTAESNGKSVLTGEKDIAIISDIEIFEVEF